jgi:hypothetical protein
MKLPSFLEGPVTPDWNVLGLGSKGKSTIFIFINVDRWMCTTYYTVHYCSVDAITAAQGVTTLEVLCLDLLIVRKHV